MATSVAITAMKPSSAMEVSAISTESVPGVEPSIAMEVMAIAKPTFTMKSAFAMELPTAPAIMIPSAVEVPAPIEAAAIIAATVKAAAVVAAMPIISVKPRADPDKRAIDEPFGSVVAIRRARKGIVVIIPVRANWRRAVISRTVVGIVGRPHPKTDYHSLRARKRCAKEANAK